MMLSPVYRVPGPAAGWFESSEAQPHAAADERAAGIHVAE
jgi:hypothetical protein